MSADHEYELVVSAENCHYHAWQCLLFHYSCTTVMERTPVIVVHSGDEPLVEGFQILRGHGGRIQRRPNFRHAGEIMYAPRNQMRTTQLVETDAAHIVVFDPDMILLAPVDFNSLIGGLPPDTITMDRISFLRVNDENRPFISDVCEASDISLHAVADTPMNGAPPHIIPTRIRGRLCQQWHVQLERYLQASFLHHGGNHSDVWISSMWGLVLGLHALGMHAELTDLCLHTHGEPALPDPNPYALIHYSYDTPGFNKRQYVEDDEWFRVWKATAPPGTASGAVCEQLAEAAGFYGLE